MSENNNSSMDDLVGRNILDRERRKRELLEQQAQTAEDRFKQMFAKEFNDSEAIRNGTAKEIREAVERGRNGVSKFKNQKEGFVGLGVKEEDL